jgi:hypothetical protein
LYSNFSVASNPRASVLECGSPLPLSPATKTSEPKISAALTSGSKHSSFRLHFFLDNSHHADYCFQMIPH